jgi:hypothetical protein
LSAIFFLICCFSLGTVLKLCIDETDDDDNVNATCDRSVGLSLDSDKASIAVLLLAMGMLITTICLVFVLAVSKSRAPIVRMASSGHVPDLELPDHCSFHVFMSHVWASGQARTHAIARKIQLLMPELKVWLDVDKLNDTSKLEHWVQASAVIVIFYSKGYFKSKNCRREIYAAIKFDKPIVLLYEGDPSVIEDMREECVTYCDGNSDGDDVPTSTSILKKLLDGDDQNEVTGSESSMTNAPIQWLNEGSFSAASLNQIYHRIMSQLPFYKRHRGELEKGIQVPGEIGPVFLQVPINILVYENNEGCYRVVEELKSMLPGGGFDMIAVTDAAGYVQKSKREKEEIDSIDSMMEEVEYGLAMPNHVPADAPVYFLFYLNQYTFQGNEQDLIELTVLLQYCIDNPDINIVLAHERNNLSKGGCDFGVFFDEAPEELISPPYSLFKDIAIPLYSDEVYRDVGLRQILCKMGAKEQRRGINRGLGMKSVRQSFVGLGSMVRRKSVEASVRMKNARQSFVSFESLVSRSNSNSN